MTFSIFPTMIVRPLCLPGDSIGGEFRGGESQNDPKLVRVLAEADVLEQGVVHLQKLFREGIQNAGEIDHETRGLGKGETAKIRCQAVPSQFDSYPLQLGGDDHVPQKAGNGNGIAGRFLCRLG